MNQRLGHGGRKRKLHPDVASILEASRKVRVKREPPPHKAPSGPKTKDKKPAATASKKPTKAKPRQQQPAPAASHNGEKARKRGPRAPGILGLCDSFSSKCDLRGSNKGTPGASGGGSPRTSHVCSNNGITSPGPNLRPKLPAFLATMAASDDWPTARVQRVASLNAMAKVHILYENDSRPAIVEADDGVSEDCKDLFPASLPSPATASPSALPSNRRRGKPSKKLVAKRKKSRLGADVEIIDTRQCRRMASLNAQAIMAASYSRERSGSRKFVSKDSPPSSSSSSSSCEVKVVHHQQEIVVCSVQTKMVRKVQEKAETQALTASSLSASSSKGCQGEGSTKRGPRKGESNKESSGSTSSSVAVSEYREVVRINTTKEMAVKDEEEKDGVTHLYHYHTKATCLQMQTTYSGEPSAAGSAPHPAVLAPAQGYYAAAAAPTAYSPALGGSPATAALMPPPPSPTTTVAPPPTGYRVAHGVVMSMAPVHRHYGSAFTVPHYGHAVPYAPAAEYVAGYYQPAGPLIQPTHEQCLIHKPVPYHPQQHRPSPSAAGYPPHPACPSGLCQQAQPPSRCYSEHLACTSPPQANSSTSQPYPYAPGGPYHPQPVQFQQPPSELPSTAPLSSSVVVPPSPPRTTADSAAGSFQITTASAAVPKSEPVTPPETKSPPQGNEFADASKGKESDNADDTTTVHPFQPEAALSVVESLPLPKKGPRTQAERQGKVAQRRASRTSSAERTLSIRSAKKSRQLEVEAAMQQPKNGVKKPPPVLLATVRLAEKKKAKLTDQPTQQASPSIEKVPSAAQLLGQKRTAQGDCTGDPEEPESPELGGVQLSALKPRKDNGVVQVPAKKATVSPVMLAKTSSVVQTKTPVAVLPPMKQLLSKRPPRRKFAHGWSWEGEPFLNMVLMNNEDPPQCRVCFPAMRHTEGDVIRVRDCVLLRSGPRKIDLPFVAKVAALWENGDDGDMMMSLLWYYRPEHTDQGRKSHHMEDEIFASKHRDSNSVACIEDKCYVLTFAEYCRYRARTKMLEEDLRPSIAVVPEPEEGYARRNRLPPGRMDPQMVFFCRRVYDYRQKRILKNPS